MTSDKYKAPHDTGLSMIDPTIERIANADGSVSARQLIQELIDAKARIRDLEAALYKWLMSASDGEPDPVDSGLYAETYTTLGLPERMSEYRDRFLAASPPTASAEPAEGGEHG